MAWTYDITKLETEPKYQVRYMIGDVEEDYQLLQDEEIQFALDNKGDVKRAAITCCETIAARLMKNPDFSLGPYSERAGDISKKFIALAYRLRSEIVSGGVPLMATPHESIFDLDMMNATPGLHLVEQEG